MEAELVDTLETEGMDKGQDKIEQMEAEAVALVEMLLTIRPLVLMVVEGE